MNPTPASKNQLKTWRKLQKKKYRYEYGLFIAEGERCVRQILENGMVDVTGILAVENLRSEDLIQMAGNIGIPVYQLEENEIRDITDTENPQGVAAICTLPKEPDVQTLNPAAGPVIAADAIQDPGNLGTMIRTAVWFGCEGLICGTGTVDPWHPKVVRSTAGSTGAIPVLSGDLNGLFDLLEREEWNIVLLDSGAGAIPVQEISEKSGTVLVVGNEANGIDRSLIRPGRKRIKIEGKETKVESLNAAISAGIAMYELGR